jgi:Mg2+/Co2+ transporter CorB
MKEGLKKIIKKIKFISENILDFLVKKESSSLRTILEDHADNKREFSVSEKNMLTNIIGFGESRVEDSMVPRADIIAVDVNISAQEVINTLDENNLKLVIKILGEEREANKIVKNIIKAREIKKIDTVNELVKIIELSKKKKL